MKQFRVLIVGVVCIYVVACAAAQCGGGGTVEGS